MRHSVLFSAMLLAGASAAWAQDDGDPVPDEGVEIAEVTEETSEDSGDTQETVEETEEETEGGEAEDGAVAGDEDGGTDEDVAQGDDGDVEDDVAEDGDGEDDGDVAEGDDGDTDGDPVVTERHDNRSLRGEERGGHHGTVSTMARAGLGPVFGALRSQGYGNIKIAESGGQIFVSATRGGETRNLVYDAATGSMLDDRSEATSGGLIERLTGKTRKERKARSGTSRKTSKTRNKSRGNSGKSRASGRGGSKDKSGGGRGNSKGGGGKSNGKGNGRNK